MSADGRLVAATSGTAVAIVDGHRGDLVTELDVGHDASVLAWAPRASCCVVAGEGRLSLLAMSPVPALVATVDAPPRTVRLVVSDDPFAVVGVSAVSDDETALFGWRGRALEAWFEPALLGATAPFHLSLDASRSRAVLAGRRGRGAADGRGEIFTGLVGLGDCRMTVIWKGEGVPFEPDGTLYPMEHGRLGVYVRSELAVLDLPERVGGVATVKRRIPLVGAEGAVASPGATYVGWIAGQRLRVVRAADGSMTADVAVPERLGSFACLAISDGGAVTVAACEKPDRVRLFGSQGGELRLRGEVIVPTPY